MRDVATGRTRHTIRDIFGATAFSPDGNTLYATAIWYPGVVRLDLTTGAVTISEPFRSMRIHRWTPGGRIIVVDNTDGGHAQVIGWDYRNGTVGFRGHVFTPSQPESDSRILDVSPDARWIVVRESTRTGGLWGFGRFATSFQIRDAATGTVRATCRGHSAGVIRARFSADGTRVFSYAELEQRATHSKLERRAWDPATGRSVDDPVATTFDFDRVSSPDGRMWVKEGRPVKLVEAATGRVRLTFTGHLGDTCGLAFSPDGRYLAVASPDAPVYVWDVRGELSKPTAPPDAKGLAAAWADLASTDAAKGFRAVRLLAHFPEQAVPYLRNKLRPATGPTADEVARLVAALDAPAFADREAAERALKKLGSFAGPAVRAAAKATTSAEVRQRAGRLIAALDAGTLTAEEVRAVRAVEAAEWMGTTAAKALVREWAGGAAGATLTAEATAAAARPGVTEGK